MNTILRQILSLSVILSGLLFTLYAHAAGTLHFSSGPLQTTLLELYTSEGCSSCPPADRWLSQMTRAPYLWRQVVPVSFHVEYWNDLGWRDRFSLPRYSSRQRQYAHRHFAKSVYTPGFFANGREWRNWFYLRNPGFNSQNRPGVLTVSVNENTVTSYFKPVKKLDSELILNLALLGFNLTTTVNAGENDGKRLRHDFVVLALHSYRGHEVRNIFTWEKTLSLTSRETKVTAIACWISKDDDPTPLQATGGWLQLKPD